MTPTDKRIDLILSVAYLELAKLPQGNTKVKKVMKKITEAIKIK